MGEKGYKNPSWCVSAIIKIKFKWLISLWYGIAGFWPVWYACFDGSTGSDWLGFNMFGSDQNEGLGWVYNVSWFRLGWVKLTQLDLPFNERRGAAWCNLNVTVHSAIPFLYYFFNTAHINSFISSEQNPHQSAKSFQTNSVPSALNQPKIKTLIPKQVISETQIS